MGTVTEPRTGDQLRASRRQRMADEIELAALQLFAQHGVEAVTVDDIADSADISRRTFFRYFSSKDDALHGHPERQLDVVNTAVGAAPATATAQALVRGILLALAAEFERRRDAVLLRKRIAARAPDAFARDRGRHAELVEAAVKAVAAHLGVDPDTDLQCRVYVQAGFGALQAAARVWLTSAANGSLEALTAEALDLIQLR